MDDRALQFKRHPSGSQVFDDGVCPYRERTLRGAVLNEQGTDANGLAVAMCRHRLPSLLAQAESPMVQAFRRLYKAVSQFLFGTFLHATSYRRPGVVQY